MTAEDGKVAIRSFRNCFKLERRIHKIDRWRLPLPFGVPLRGIGYALAAEFAILILSALPVVGLPLAALNPLFRLVVLPILLAFLMTSWEIDGRPCHAALRSWVSLRLRPARLVAWRPADELGPVALGPVTVAPDDRSARPRPAVIVGPARILMRYPFKARMGPGPLRVTPVVAAPQWRGQQIVLERGQRMVIR